MNEKIEEVSKQLTELGYDHALAVATAAEVESGAACGQLALLVETEEK